MLCFFVFSSLSLASGALLRTGADAAADDTCPEAVAAALDAGLERLGKTLRRMTQSERDLREILERSPGVQDLAAHSPEVAAVLGDSEKLQRELEALRKMQATFAAKHQALQDDRSLRAAAVQSVQAALQDLVQDALSGALSEAQLAQTEAEVQTLVERAFTDPAQIAEAQRLSLELQGFAEAVMHDAECTHQLEQGRDQLPDELQRPAPASSFAEVGPVVRIPHLPRITKHSARGRGSSKKLIPALKSWLRTPWKTEAHTLEDSGPPGADLDWTNLTFAVKGKPVLRDVHGAARAGRVLAVMGPSGSGKTSLLTAVAGNLRATKAATLTGTLLCDGAPCGGAGEVAGLRTAFVDQTDNFYTQMTVRETLLFAARLRLPASVSLAEKQRRVDEILRKLSLEKAADTLIGDGKARGISGGERKRLAIGCELLSDPQLLFLDEPTSGLDSFQAQQVVTALQRLAHEDGCTVMMSIHQPRGSIYAMFDDLLLLSEGRVMYSGQASTAKDHFARLGASCPPNINPGEFLVDLVSVSHETPEAEEESYQRINQFAEAAAVQHKSVQPRGPPVDRRGKSTVKRSGPLTQFLLLFRRAWKEVARSKAAIAVKVVQQVMVSAIYGGIYSLTNSQTSIQDRFGLLSLVAIGAGNMGIASMIRTFPKEKAIVNNEREKGMYSMAPYFLSKVVAEAPLNAMVSALSGACLYPMVGLNPAPGKFEKFVTTLVLEGLASSALGLVLGAVAPSTDVALAMFPPILVLMLVFNGFNIANENAPKALQWIPKASFIRWCSEALAVNEFTGLKFACQHADGSPVRGPCCETGEQALARVNMENSTVKHANEMQGRIIGACYATTLLALQRSRPKHLSVEPAK